MAFATTYKAAIIFLIVIVVISLFLVLLYFILKRGMCCNLENKRLKEEEGFYVDNEKDDYDFVENGGFEISQDEDLTPSVSVDELLPGTPTLEKSDCEIPDVLVTESNFMEPKKRKKSHMHSIFKKLKKTSGRVRFKPASEETSLMETGVHSHGNMSRSDSMESFMSGLSAVTMAEEEFGEELSPSRVQISIQYDPESLILTVGCKQADYLITTDRGTTYWQVHMTLLPLKKHRFKTRYKSTSTPVFNQNFQIDNIHRQSLAQMSVRYRIYGRIGRAGKKKVAGETEVELAGLNSENNLLKEWRTLKRKNQQR